MGFAPTALEQLQKQPQAQNARCASPPVPRVLEKTEKQSPKRLPGLTSGTSGRETARPLAQQSGYSQRGAKMSCWLHDRRTWQDSFRKECIHLHVGIAPTYQSSQVALNLTCPVWCTFNKSQLSTHFCPDCKLTHFFPLLSRESQIPKKSACLSVCLITFSIFEQKYPHALVEPRAVLRYIYSSQILGGFSIRKSPSRKGGGAIPCPACPVWLWRCPCPGTLSKLSCHLEKHRAHGPCNIAAFPPKICKIISPQKTIFFKFHQKYTQNSTSTLKSRLLAIASIILGCSTASFYTGNTVNTVTLGIRSKSNVI